MTEVVWKTLASVFAKIAVSSTSFISKRTSGLSEPYSSIAWVHVMRGITSIGRDPVTASAAANTDSEMHSRMSSWVTKLISASSWVNSN